MGTSGYESSKSEKLIYYFFFQKKSSNFNHRRFVQSLNASLWKLISSCSVFLTGTECFSQALRLRRKIVLLEIRPCSATFWKKVFSFLYSTAEKITKSIKVNSKYQTLASKWHFSLFSYLSWYFINAYFHLCSFNCAGCPI